MTPTLLNDVVDPDALALAIGAAHVRRQVHPTLPLSILNYTERCQYERAWSPTTRATRGLIVNDRDEVVARPWAKFFNYGEPECPPLDLSAPARVTDKIDGSLGILYPTGSGWAIATRGSFTSDQALHATALLAKRYPNFTPVPGMTVLFEIVYPENRIVCDYGGTDDLVLLGAVDIDTGQSLSPAAVLGWPGPVTQTFDAATLADALSLPPRPGAEGLVVWVGDTAVKLKQADYVALHRIVTGLNARVVWEHLVAGLPVDALCEPLPDEFHPWVREHADALQREHRAILARARTEHAALLAEMPDGWGRKDYAAKASRSPMRAWLFMLLDGKDPSSKIWLTLRPSGEERPLQVTEDAA